MGTYKMDLDLWVKHTQTLASFQTLSLKQCQANVVKAFPPFKHSVKRRRDGFGTL